MKQIYRLMNLPTRDGEGNLNSEIKGIVRGTGKEKYIQLSCGDWKITDYDLPLANDKDIADTIAHLIEMALDTGFEQGRTHVRKAMGL